MADLIDRAALVAMIRTRASELADMAIKGLPENARNREAMEAALTALLPAIAALPAQGVRVKPLWQPIETAPRGGEWFIARTERGTTRVVHFADEYDRFPISHDGVTWPTAPTEWTPLAPVLAALAPAEAGGVEARDAAIEKMVKVAATQLWGEEAAERVSYSVSYGDEADTEAADGDLIWRKDALAACGITHSARYAEQTIAALAPAEAGGVEAISEITEADYANIIAHLSPELEPRGPLPNRNSLMMEVVRLRNQVKTQQPAPVDALVKAAEAMLEYTADMNPLQGYDEEKDHPAVIEMRAALAAYRGGAK